MNKKVSLIVAIFVALVSIVFVSIFGLLPEDLRPNIKVESLYFDIEANSSGSKVLTMNFKANNNTINLDSMVKYGPLDATNVVFQYSTDQPKDKVVVTSTGILTIYDLSLMSFTVTIKTTDSSNISDSLVIKKPDSNESNFGDDDWEWGV